MASKIKLGSACRHIRENGSVSTDIVCEVSEKERVSFRGKIKRLIHLGLVNGDVNEVEVESLNKYLAYETNIIENYISIKEFVEVLGIKFTYDVIASLKRRLKELGSHSPFECINVEYQINQQTFFITKLSVEKFLKEYIPLHEVKNRYDYSSAAWSINLRKYGIRPLVLTSEKQFISKKEYEILEQHFSTKILSNELTQLGTSERGLGDYYTLEESKQILSIKAEKCFKLIIKDYNLSFKVAKDNRKYFKKEDINILKTLQTELRQKYISAQEAKELATAEGFTFFETYITGVPVDSLLSPLFTKKKSMYSREEFNNWLEERKKKSEFFSVSLESDFSTFEYRLKIKEVDIGKLGPFTSETWFQFISSTLRKSKASKQTIDGNIFRYVYCTERLINLVSLTKNKEIYSITSNDINTLFNNIPKTDSTIIYVYLKQVYNQLNFKKMKAFDFNKVYDPRKLDKEHQEKTIYEYEVYKRVYNYSKDIYLHKKRAIRGVLEEISNKGKRSKLKNYAASWLYVLLHLNNAWRHSDVVTFPQVNLSGTQITDLNWMLENELSDEDADYIIKQVYRAEFIISKTQVKNYFFCSEELKKPFATAIAICQLRINILNPLRISIIDFGNKKQDFSDSRRKNFFELYDDKEFVFSSRKMNRSLMTYIYVLLSKMQKGTAGLKTIQKMRGHLEKETTNIYVDIPEEEINFLTRQLFARGSFGFIYDTFLDVLQGVEPKREIRTAEIQFLDTYFGGIYKIEEISSFLNVIQRDRKAILDRILSMGLDEALDFVNKIETNQLPSKQDNVQCMVAESGCVKKGQGVDCFDCAFNIPNYYSLSALGASLQDRLNNYVYSQKSDSEKPYYEQRKCARLFYIHLEMFAQAFVRFGFDVYEFLEDSREEFIEKQALLGSFKENFQLN